MIVNKHNYFTLRCSMSFTQLLTTNSRDAYIELVILVYKMYTKTTKHVIITHNISIKNSAIRQRRIALYRIN